MPRLSSLARLCFIALALSAAGWWWTGTGPQDAGAWSAAHAWHLDRSHGAPIQWVANDLDAVRLPAPSKRASLAETAVTPRQTRDTHVAGVEPYSTTDDSDQSDPSARVEARAGPIVCGQSRPLLSISRFGLCSRTRSSSAPRAPPLELRLA